MRRVRDLDIEIPYSSMRIVTTLTVWDMASPKTASFSAAEVEISLTARFDVAVDACAHTAYDWRLELILDDLTRLLDPDFSALGWSGLVDDAVRRVVPRMRPHARLLTYRELLGPDRFSRWTHSL